jgi:hypothetical protein
LLSDPNKHINKGREMRKIATTVLLASAWANFLSSVNAHSLWQLAPVAVQATACDECQGPLNIEMLEGAQVVQQVRSIQGRRVMGKIDWNQKIVYSVGEGVPPLDAISPAQARVSAKRAAIDDAYTRLLETVQAVQVDASWTARSAVIENRVVRIRVNGLVRYAEVLELEQSSDGSIRVMMKMPLIGASGLASAIFPLALANARQTTDAIQIQKEARALVPVRHTHMTKYSSLIVDAKGLRVKPALYPVIRAESGETIYSIESADPNAIVEEGLCTYKKTIEEAMKLPSTGERPLIVKATRIGGKYGVDIIVSEMDAKKIAEANQLDPFLGTAKVTVLVD